MTTSDTSSGALTEQSREVVQALYDAAIAGDVAGLLSRLADDVVVHEPPFLPYGGRYEGKDGFQALFGKIVQLYDVSAIRAEYLVADGERVFGVIRMPDLKTGQDVLLAEQSVVRNGKVVEMRIFFHDAQSLIDQPKLV